MLEHIIEMLKLAKDIVKSNENYMKVLRKKIGELSNFPE
jgi:hypothetical protein